MIKKTSSNIKNFLSVTLLISFTSCKSNQEQTIPVYNGPKVVEAKGYIVPKDSIAIPEVLLAGNPKVVQAGKPKVIITSTNEHLAGIPKIVIAGIPKVCTPGQENFSLPKTSPTMDSQYIAGIPEVVIAKEARSKDQNSHSFSSFGKLQGLKSNVIYCMLQDKNGNLWIGTQGQGVFKYDGKNFTQYSEKEGLSKFVRSILEDKNGNLWFGTWAEGVIKYDGKTFTRFTGKAGLINNFVLSILEDKKGDLWFGTAGGVTKYDGMSFTHFTEKEGLSNNSVNCILEDSNENLWIGTNGGGVSKYDGKSFVHFTVKEGLSNNFISSILEDRSGYLWFGTIGGGVNKYDGKSFIHVTVREGLSNNFINSILEDRSGNLWFGTNGGGVNKFDGKRFSRFTEKEGLSSNVIWTTLEDENGNLWFGTWFGGVNKYDTRRFTHLTEKEGLSLNSVTCILEDKSSNLWFGMTDDGVCKYDGKSFTHFTMKEGLGSNTVWIMMEDRGGNLWFGTNAGVTKYDGKRFISFTEKEGLVKDIKCMLEDKNGNIWFGAYQGPVIKYDGKYFTKFSSKEGLSLNVHSIVEDKSGNLWFGSYNEGVTKYDQSSEWISKDKMDGGSRFAHFTIKQGLTNNDVRFILEDKEGNLWFSTLGGGVSKYQPSYEGNKASFTHYTDKEGLSNNHVRSMMEDKSGNLWFGTYHGLNKLEQKKQVFNTNESGLLFKSYASEEGFSGIGIKPGKTICEAKDGTIWICTDDRLTAFHPGEETPDTIPPNIQLTGLALFNQYVSWPYLEKNQDSSILLGKDERIHGYTFKEVSKWYGIPQQLSLSHDNNQLSFRYVGTTLHSPHKVRYQYMLQGQENNWSDWTTQTEIPYTNLSAGTYNFKVKAMNSEGYSSKELNYTFTIRPPWWLTWWFISLSIVSMLGGIALIMYWWVRHTYNQKLKVQIVRQKIAADLHDEIGSNLSSMTFAAELIKKKLNGSRQDIDPILNQLISSTQESSTLISDTIWSLNSQNESFEKLVDHMKNFTHDLLSAKEISYQFNTVASAPLTALTLEQKRNINLIFKEAINNIAKHSKATEAIIKLHSLSEKLSIEIKDNGTGFDKSNIQHGSGLNNFKLRSSPSCEVHYASHPGEGTLVQILAVYQTYKISDHPVWKKDSIHKSDT